MRLPRSTICYGTRAFSVVRGLQYLPRTGEEGYIMINTNGVAPMIEAAGLRKSYGETEAVKGIDLQVRPGDAFGCLGPNGAGKTTTIKMLVGLLRPSGGAARIGGYDIQREPIAAKSLIGYVPDQPYLPEKLTAREFLQFIAGLYQVDLAAARRRGEELLK